MEEKDNKIPVYRREIWKNIKGFYGQYMVSNTGQVKSKKGLSEKILNPKKGSSGRLQLCLIDNGVRISPMLTKLVYEAFKEPVPDGFETYNIDGNPSNNHIDNIGIRLYRVALGKNHDKTEKGRTSKYIGVYWSKQKRKCHSVINVEHNGKWKQEHLGFFENEIDAHFAYDKRLSSLMQAE